MCAAAKAVIKLLGGAYRKTGRFFIVERAASREIRTGFFQRNTFINHVDHVNAIKKFLNKALWNQNIFSAIQIL